MPNRLTRCLAGACFCFAFANAIAQPRNYLSAAEIRKLLIGNTIVAQRPNGTQFQAYFEASGKWFRKEHGRDGHGTWRILDDGRQCVTVAQEDSCALIQRNNDGTYTRVVDAKPHYRWLAIKPGRAFD
jgi:hypothetical protein